MKFILLILSVLIVGVFSVNINLNKEPVLASATQSIQHHTESIRGTPAECELCSFVCGYIEGMLEHNNKTQGEIVDEVEKLCKFVKPELRNTCDSFVSVYTNQIIQAIFDKETPNQICTQIKLCTTTTNISASNKVMPAAKPKSNNIIVNPLQSLLIEVEVLIPKVGSTQCTICEAIVSKLENLISTNKTESEIIADLDDGCAFFKVYADQCKQMVQQYVPELVQIINNTEDPEQACTSVKLCP